MNSTLLKIIDSREDLSEYLFHFTKGSKALKTLEQIVSDNAIKDMNNNGYICFSEIPLLMTAKMFDIFGRYKNPLFAPFGIAIKKTRLYKLGGRTVIYGPKSERNYFKKSTQWRYEEYIPATRDYSWLREWRIPVSSIPISKDNCFVIANTNVELYEIIFDVEGIGEIKFDGCEEDGKFNGAAYTEIDRLYRGVSMEEISKVNNMPKKDLRALIASQHNRSTRFNLGSI